MSDLHSPAVTSRRDFLTQGAVAVGAFGLGRPGPVAAEAGQAGRPPLIGFSKPFQKLDAERTAELVADVGWDGIECPVRARGQVEPERAPDELPRFAEALRRRGRDVHLVATDITSLKTPHAEKVLQTLAALGIKRFRLGFFTYPPDGSPAERLKEVAPALKDIAAACRDLGLQAGVQNHSGARYVGAPVWDVYSIIRDLDPRHIGFCFDIGHATVEGGLSWPIEARLAEPFYTAVFVKDFYWKKGPGGWKETWCPLGEGMVSRAFHLQRDLKVLKEWLA